jgi:hypothetical protein
MQFTTKLVCAFLCLALASIAFAAVCVGVEAVKVGRRLDSTLTDTRRVMLSLGGVTTDLRAIAESYKKQADAQAQALTDTTKALNKTTLALNTDLVALGGVIGHLDTQIEDNGKGLAIVQLEATQTLWDIQDAVSKAQPMFEQATITLDNTARLTGSPELQDTLAHLNATAAHTEAITASAERDALVLEKRLNQLLKPASIGKRVLMFLLQTAPPIVTAVR